MNNLTLILTHYFFLFCNEIKMNSALEHVYLDFFKEEKWSYIGILALHLIIFPTESIFLPQRYVKTVNHLRKETNLPSLLSKNPLERNGPRSIVLQILGAWTGVIILYGVVETLTLNTSPKLISHIRKTVFNALIERYGSNFKAVESGKTISRIMSLTLVLQRNAEWFTDDFVPVAVAVVLIWFYIVFQKNALHMAISMSVGIGTIGTFLYLRGKTIINLSAEREKFYHEMNAEMNDSFDNLFEVYNQNMESAEKTRNTERLQEYEQKSQKELQYMRNTNIITTLMVVATFAAVLITGYRAVQQGKVRGEAMGATIIIFVYFVDWMLNLSHTLPMALRRIGIIKDSLPFLNNLFDLRKQERTLTNVIAQGKIQVKDVTFAYDTAQPVLNNLNIVIEPGTSVAILGRSGSGKSTLVKLIMQMQTLQSGHILLDGHDASKISLHHLRSKVNYINQNTHLINSTILDNMQFGNRASSDTIERILTTYGLDRVFSERPGKTLLKKLQSPVGVNGSLLSLGMQKVTMLLRGILKSSVIYMFDEPVAGLDSNTRTKVLQMIRAECKGKTCVYITHIDAVRQFADKSYNLKELNHPSK